MLELMLERHSVESIMSMFRYGFTYCLIVVAVALAGYAVGAFAMAGFALHGVPGAMRACACAVLATGACMAGLLAVFLGVSNVLLIGLYGYEALCRVIPVLWRVISVVWPFATAGIGIPVGRAVYASALGMADHESWKFAVATDLAGLAVCGPLLVWWFR